jgi:hypothetical protein
MTTNTPCLITIKLLAVSGAPVTKDVAAALAQFGTVMQYEAANLVFDGNALVPAPSPVAPAPVNPTTSTQTAKPKVKVGGIKPDKQREAIRNAQAAQAARRAKDKREEPTEPKPINLAEGSNPERIFNLIRSGPALTSTQIRETLGLDSNVVNTTVYRLKHAGMIRPMSHNAPNGDTLYTSTEWDPKPAAEVTNDDE